MSTVMDFWCEFRGQQGGTIHEALYTFQYTLTTKERDKFCSVLSDNTAKISDLHHVQDFIKLRLKSEGIVFSNVK